MESESKDGRAPNVQLEDITSFLGKSLDEADRGANLGERIDSAIVLLQAVPCARYAVLEKLGEAFHDAAKQYIVEMERQQLAGASSSIENMDSKREEQIQKIQQVLAAAMDVNTTTWGQIIYQWSVRTLGQICGQYATGRSFSSYTLDHRLQLWLNCQGTKTLLHIAVSSMQKIKKKDGDACIQILLNTTISHTPYFDWALAHFASCFHDTIPYRILCYALEAFSNQYRNAEAVIETVIHIFKFLIPQQRSMIEKSFEKLFQEAMTSVSDLTKEQKHKVLCTIPFLLHISIVSPSLINPLVETLIESLSHRFLFILQEHSSKRDAVLQRGLLPRTVDCIKNLKTGTFKVFQFLLKYAAKEDLKLVNGDPNLAHSTQIICSIILESLIHDLQDDVSVFAHLQKYPMITTKAGKVEGTSKNPFLQQLASYYKQLCSQLVDSNGTKKDVLERFVKLIGIQDGLPAMSHILVHLLLHSKSEENLSCFTRITEEFAISEAEILKVTSKRVFEDMLSMTNGYSQTQLSVLFHNLRKILSCEKKIGLQNTPKITMMKLVKENMKHIAQAVMMYTNSQVAEEGTKLLLMLSQQDLSLFTSDFAIVIQAVVVYYLHCLKTFVIDKDKQDFRSMYKIVRNCDSILANVVKTNPLIQQYAVRLLVEGRLKKGEEKEEEDISCSGISFPLLANNYNEVNPARVNTNMSSVMRLEGGLNKRKRNMEHHTIKDNQLSDQIVINTLTMLLSIPNAMGPSRDVTFEENSFAGTWCNKKFSRPFLSAYAFLANLLTEIVCPEVLPILPWPDEDFLKYTIERDLKVKNRFDHDPILWEMLEVVASARPVLYHCSVLIQGLLGLNLKYWNADRKGSASQSSKELETTTRLLNILQTAGWLPAELDALGGILHMLKPKEVYQIVSALWSYLKISSFSPEHFLERDKMGRPQIIVLSERLSPLKTVLKEVFFRNIEKLGPFYHRFFQHIPKDPA